MVYLIIQDVSFLHFRILSKTESSLHTAAGIKESISDGTALIMMDLDMNCLLYTSPSKAPEKKTEKEKESENLDEEGKKILARADKMAAQYNYDLSLIHI